MNKKALIKNISIILGVLAILGFTAFEVTVAGDKSNPALKTTAWYVANIKLAKEQNKICFENVNIQQTDECINSLHALQITFNGGN